MKKKLIFVIALVTGLFIISCEKDTLISDPEAGLTGKWKSTESYLGTGGGTDQWQQIAKKDVEYLILNADKKVSGDYSTATTYEIVDSIKLNMINTTKNFKYLYFYKVTATTLQLSGYGCIEGCSVKFVRVK